MRLFKKQLVVLTLNVLVFFGIVNSISTFTTSYFKGEAASTTVVILEAYGGGNNSGATYQKDYFVLYNYSSSSVNLSGWSFQQASATGSTWQKKDLTGSIGAFGYYLIEGSGGTANGISIPSPDIISTINFGSSGKLALKNDTILLDSATPSLDNSSIIDFLGIGSTASKSEGSNPTGNPSNTTSVQRKGLLIDTDNNGNDFEISSPTPKNSSSNSGLTEASSFSTSFNDSTNNKFGACTNEGLDWLNLKSTYTNLSKAGKREFALNSNATVLDARTRYSYLISYNNSLDKFATLQ